MATRRRHQQGCRAAGGEAGEGGGGGATEAVAAPGDVSYTIKHSTRLDARTSTARKVVFLFSMHDCMARRVVCLLSFHHCMPEELCACCPSTTCRLCKRRRMHCPGQEACRSASQCWRHSECSCRRCVQQVHTPCMSTCSRCMRKAGNRLLSSAKCMIACASKYYGIGAASEILVV